MSVSLTRDNGKLKIDIGGKLFDPLAFKSFRPNPRNISEFYRAGCRLFCVLSSGIVSALGVPYSLYGESWIGEGEYDFSPLDRQMEMFLENAPDAYFAPMFQLDTRSWYLKNRPGFPNSFTHLSQMAGDEEWRRDASAYLTAMMTHCEEKYGARIFGYFLLCGSTTEWLSERDFEESHPIKESAYRRYCKDESAKLPTLDVLNRTGDVFLDENEKEVYRARRFHSALVTDTALYFAHQAQEVVQHKKLIGMYFGYLLEIGRERLYNCGHLDYEPVFLSPDIDMIASPSAYKYRLADDPSGFMVTQKTLDAHNKLLFHEFDHITHVAPDCVNEPVAGGENQQLVRIPGAVRRCHTEAESLNVMYRDFLLCNANGASLWWFDMFDGWFRTDKMMRAIADMISLTKSTLSRYDRSSIAEIAVFAEGESMCRLRKSSTLASVCLSWMRRSFAEIGAPYDLYSVCDLSLCEERHYKLIILLDCYDIPEQRMELLRRLQRKGVRILWMYAPDYAHDGKNDTEAISRAVGMHVTSAKTSHGV